MYRRMTIGLVVWVSSIFLLFACVEKKDRQGIEDIPSDWNELLAEARGQVVHFNAWGGSIKINAYIHWVSDQVKDLYDITLTHVQVTNGLEAPRKIQEEQLIGKHNDGSVDLLWLNGLAFNLLYQQKLFLGNILDLIPNKQYIDMSNKILFEDFTMPTEGKEVPWGTAQFSFFHKPTVSAFEHYTQLFDIVTRYPRQFTYPSPDLDFTGRTFVKGLLYAHASEEEKTLLYTPYTNSDEQNKVLAQNKAWELLERMNPYLWRQGKSFPSSYADMISLFKDGEISYGMTFNPYDVASRVSSKEFSEDVQSFIPQEGSISNAHFLTIPYNASSKEAALVIINFLLSPEAQARKSDPEYWGDPSVLDIKQLGDEGEYFDNIAQHKKYLAEGIGVRTIKEFHSTWEPAIQQLWKSKFVTK